MTNDPLQLIRDALVSLVTALNDFNEPYMLIGAVAVGLTTRPRATEDVDASIWMDDDDRIPELIKKLAEHSIVPRARSAEEFARNARVLLVVHQASAIPIDIALACTPYESIAIRHATKKTIKGLQISLPRVEDLIIMKSLAMRGQDKKDIALMLELREDLDFKYIRKWARLHAKAIEAPERIDELEDLIKGVSKHLSKLKRVTKKKSLD